MRAFQPSQRFATTAMRKSHHIPCWKLHRKPNRTASVASTLEAQADTRSVTMTDEEYAQYQVFLQFQDALKLSSSFTASLAQSSSCLTCPSPRTWVINPGDSNFLIGNKGKKFYLLTSKCYIGKSLCVFYRRCKCYVLIVIIICMLCSKDSFQSIICEQNHALFKLFSIVFSSPLCI